MQAVGLYNNTLINLNNILTAFRSACQCRVAYRRVGEHWDFPPQAFLCCVLSMHVKNCLRNFPLLGQNLVCNPAWDSKGHGSISRSVLVDHRIAYCRCVASGPEGSASFDTDACGVKFPHQMFYCKTADDA